MHSLGKWIPLLTILLLAACAREVHVVSLVVDSKHTQTIEQTRRVLLRRCEQFWSVSTRIHGSVIDLEVSRRRA
jgi:hypothetical protein